ncbi:hypothetical protein ACFQ8C_13390 [Streptomyces sp. NPDC056503]|uniref:hypothetical protein n=1 Tax=Streptomyces sp. NPDC056503 TaxID=3345842 RepID=UPI0036B6E251
MMAQPRPEAPADRCEPVPCSTHAWCVIQGRHEDHASAPTRAGAGRGGLLDALVLASGADAPTVGFLDLDLSPAELRQQCRDLRAHLDKVEALADALDAADRGGERP